MLTDAVKTLSGSHAPHCLRNSIRSMQASPTRASNLVGRLFQLNLRGIYEMAYSFRHSNVPLVDLSRSAT